MNKLTSAFFLKNLLTSWLVLVLALPAWAINSEIKVMVVGDSLSAGYGINPKDGWVQLLELELKKTNPKSSVINNSVSGDTTANGLTRLPSSLALHQPDLVIIELGGNDGLRGSALSIVKNNLVEMVKLAQSTEAKVLLMEMRIPPNMGKRYTDKFTEIYSEVAREHNATLVPFFLNDVATDKDLMQADGIHPTQAAQPLMMQSVLNVLEKTSTVP